MFKAEIYIERRKTLSKSVGHGLVLLLGNHDSALNYKANIYPFRQDSTFLYYVGLRRPDLAAVINAESGECILFGNEYTMQDKVWSGNQAALTELAQQSGIRRVKPLSSLAESLKTKSGEKIHFLPQYRGQNIIQLCALLDQSAAELEKNISWKLIQAIVSQRSIKTSLELDQIEDALEVTSAMHRQAMKMSKAGMVEREIAGFIEGFALAQGRRQAYGVIFTTHGEFLHNQSYDNVLQPGDLVLMDAGAESPLGYASDITRTFPVSGKFSLQQQEIYELVLKMQEESIALCSPGVPYRDIHLAAARIAVSGLKDLGIMRGDTDEAVSQGAHALFFPHGLGHMLGLDVHDMENYGEDFIGYNDKYERNHQFGLNNLRLARPLEAGHVLTVEPGLYFITHLIKSWEQEQKLNEFIDYGELDKYSDFGGIRIEDNITILEQGCRVLGETIPKSIGAVEEACS